MNDIPRSNNFFNEKGKKTNLDFSNMDYEDIIDRKDKIGREDPTLVSCQQMLEKLMKYIIKKNGGHIEEVHKLKRLRRDLESLGIFINYKKYNDLLQELTDCYFERRYENDEYYCISREEFNELVQLTLELREELMKWI